MSEVQVQISSRDVEISGTQGFSYFWKTGPFTNWAFSEYTLDNPYSEEHEEIAFSRVEQGMMWEKAMFFGDTQIASRILSCNDPQHIKALGRQVAGFSESLWKRNRVGIVYRHLLAKFSQNSNLRQSLMNTKNKLLVEASPMDKIWGCGLNAVTAAKTPVNKWPGLNLLGKLLTAVREELRQ